MASICGLARTSFEIEFIAAVDLDDLQVGRNGQLEFRTHQSLEELAQGVAAGSGRNGRIEFRRRAADLRLHFDGFELLRDDPGVLVLVLLLLRGPAEDERLAVVLVDFSIYITSMDCLVFVVIS